MVPVKLIADGDGYYSSENIRITNLETWIRKKTVTDENNNGVNVPLDFAAHCNVLCTNRFLSRLTLIISAVDSYGYIYATITGSVLCMEKGQKWEFYARTKDLGYYDRSDCTTGYPSASKIRGASVYANCQAKGWDVYVYVLEELELGAQEDPDSLGKIF